MSWSCADPKEKREGPIIGKCFNIHIDIEHHTRSKAIEYLKQLAKEIESGLTNVSAHPTSDQDTWEEAFPNAFVSCGWKNHIVEYGNKEYEEYKKK
jgi:hypothetical protein